jgi:hypothetical protein
MLATRPDILRLCLGLFISLFINGITSPAKVEVYDVSGKLLLAKILNTNQIDISYLSKGLYFIKQSTAEVNTVRKFVKE